MCKKTVVAALQFILYRPTLLLIIALVVLGAFKGPKSPPIFQGKEMHARQAESATGQALRSWHAPVPPPDPSWR
jgi:hypothetical protein